MRLVARDQGEPAQYSYTRLVVRVEDADDQNPVFSQERYEAVLPSPGLAGSLLSVLPSRLEAADRDLGLNSSVFYSWAGAGPHYRHFNIHTRSGEISLSGDLTRLEEFLKMDNDRNWRFRLELCQQVGVLLPSSCTCSSPCGDTWWQVWHLDTSPSHPRHLSCTFGERAGPGGWRRYHSSPNLTSPLDC